MNAVVEIAGQQFEVENKQQLYVPKLQGEPGDTVTFDNILLATDGDNSNVGTPYVEGSVEAKIIEHTRDKKVLVFHKKRRKGYQKLNGHRQHFTQIEITNININN
jgi:large subunit ribosomal protein L21